MRIERRQTRRERLFQHASVVFNGRQSMFACTLRNQSETGALLRLADWTDLPALFEIDTREGETQRVKQCWRRGDDVGVAFLTQGESDLAAPLDFAAFRAARTALTAVRATSLAGRARDQFFRASCLAEKPALPA